VGFAYGKMRAGAGEEVGTGMRRDARTDKNQSEIVRGLKEACRSVVLLHRVGGGVPDLLVGFKGKMWLLEVKIEKGKLNDLQQDFFDTWRGPRPVVVRNLDDALEATK